jgi:hypothetical protein
MIVMSFSLDASDIGAVLEFSQAKTPNILILYCPFNIVSMFFRAQVKQGLHIQEPMYTILDGKGSVIVDICATDETELVGVLEVVVI